MKDFSDTSVSEADEEWNPGVEGISSDQSQTHAYSAFIKGQFCFKIRAFLL